MCGWLGLIVIIAEEENEAAGNLNTRTPLACGLPASTDLRVLVCEQMSLGTVGIGTGPDTRTNWAPTTLSLEMISSALVSPVAPQHP